MNNNNMIYLVLVVVVFVFIFWYFSGRTSFPNEGELTMHQSKENESSPVHEDKDIENYSQDGEEYIPNSNQQPVGQSTGQDPNVCYPQNQLNPSELLPQDYSSTWAKCNPMGAGPLQGQNFLDAGHHIGINTVGQVLRNANLQLRSEPPNPQVTVSPFNVPSIEPDISRRYFELGQC